VARSERRRLLDWYRTSARDLPWRRTRDPWAIWVSETMLQQTRVETVRRYYPRFLDRFPTPAALARASEDAVLSSWSGLGYYRRARMLHAAAKVVAAEHGGRVPAGAEARRALPGVGRYTAGALGSIAFGLPEPIVDGNVARVLSRLRGIEAPIGTPSSERALWAEAEALVRGDDPGALNQALMELGATVCTPRAPRCDDCPIRAGCIARASGRAEILPVPRARRAPREVELVAVVALDGRDRPWLVRSEDALFGGLFGPPMAEGTTRAAAARALAAVGLEGTIGAHAAARVAHVLTHRRLDVRIFVGRARGRATATRKALDAGARADVGVSKLAEKILAAARPGP
jgi:A/G-specific adenine glycosylase